MFCFSVKKDLDWLYYYFPIIKCIFYFTIKNLYHSIWVLILCNTHNPRKNSSLTWNFYYDIVDTLKTSEAHKLVLFTMIDVQQLKTEIRYLLFRIWCDREMLRRAWGVSKLPLVILMTFLNHEIYWPTLIFKCCLIFFADRWMRWLR